MLTRPKWTEGVRWRHVEWIERRLCRFLRLPSSQSFAEQIDCSVLITRIPYSNVVGEAGPSQSLPFGDAPLISLCLLAVAIVTILYFLWMVTRSSPYFGGHRERGVDHYG